MSKLVSNARQAIDNLSRFASELDSEVELQRRLAFVRAWYAIQDLDGNWHFAPSKFCGYEGMTAKEYVNDDPRDGRRTEKQLQQWFTQVPSNEELFDELYAALTNFLARYGKSPSSAIRINVTNEFFNKQIIGNDVTQAEAITDLLIAVARGLSDAERIRIKAAI